MVQCCLQTTVYFSLFFNKIRLLNELLKNKYINPHVVFWHEEDFPVPENVVNIIALD